MAFRRRFRRSSFGRRGPSVRSLAATQRKWIGFHDLAALSAFNVDPGTPQLLEVLPTFLPLVNIDDYSNENIVDLSSEQETQERTRVIRSIGHASVIPLMQVAVDNPVIAIVEFWWYFAVLKSDDIANAANLAAATGTGSGAQALDTYNLGLIPAPALHRQPIKRFGYRAVQLVEFHGTTPDESFLSNVPSKEFQWDFRPRARMQIPDAWWLVCGANVSFAQPVPAPEAFSILLTVGARTLIAD